MGPTALDGLKPPAPEIVRRFYGLVDGTPWTQPAIAEHLGLPKHRVQAILTSAPVTRLLGEPTHRTTVVVACAVCGAAVERTPQQLRDRAQTTCGPACRREFQRRQVPRLVGDAATRAKRLEHLRQKTSSPEFADKSRQRALGRARPHAETLRALPSGVFAGLPAQEQDLLRRYYGLDGDPPRTLKELAREGRIGTHRVRQLVDQGLARVLHQVGHPAAPPLPAAIERPTACTDHPCDGCGVCRRGQCCRGDNPARQVHLGDWDGAVRCINVE
jgi:hypothetical protein